IIDLIPMNDFPFDRVFRQAGAGARPGRRSVLAKHVHPFVSVPIVRNVQNARRLTRRRRYQDAVLLALPQKLSYGFEDAVIDRAAHELAHASLVRRHLTGASVLTDVDRLFEDGGDVDSVALAFRRRAFGFSRFARLKLRVLGWLPVADLVVAGRFLLLAHEAT